MSLSNRWKEAQREELVCWEQITPQLQSGEYWEHKRELWRRIVGRIGIKDLIFSLNKGTEKTRILKMVDVGCGPSGIFCELPTLITKWLSNQHKKFKYYNVDPLASHYLQMCPRLTDFPVIWINGLGENLEQLIETPVHIIFAINTIDHSKDIRKFLYSIMESLCTGGIAVISLNCHSYRLTARLWSVFNIEKLHPYQMTKDMFIKLLVDCVPFLHLEKVTCLDEDYFWLTQQSREICSGKRRNERRRLRSTVKNVAERLGLRYHGRYADDQGVFHNYAFILRKRSVL